MRLSTLNTFAGLNVSGGVQEADGSGHMTYGAHADAVTDLNEPEQEPEEEQAPWDDITPLDPETSAIGAAARQSNDIFGPADEFD